MLEKGELFCKRRLDINPATVDLEDKAKTSIPQKTLPRLSQIISKF
jgi:hypothetical protein